MSIAYLLNLSVSGIKNIEKPIELSFYKKTIKNDFDPSQYRIKGIYGENGSGKTAIMFAVDLLKRLVLDKDYLSDTITQRNLIENVNKKTKKGSIEIEFLLPKVEKFIYKYKVAFSVRDEKRFYITGEEYQVKIGVNSRNKYKTVFKTEDGSISEFYPEGWRNTLKRRTQNLLEQSTLPLFALEMGTSSAKKLKKADDIMAITHLLALFIIMGSLAVYIDNEDDHIKYISNNLIENLDDKADNEEMMRRIKKALKDENEDDHYVLKNEYESFKKYVSNMCSFIQIFKKDLMSIEIETIDYNDKYKYDLVLKYNGYSLSQEFESRGIRKLIKLYSYLVLASTGCIVFIDELDSNINDVYLNKIIGYIMHYGQGQLCFTAHNLSLMKILKENKSSISFISNVNTIHTWASAGNKNPENAYRDGFIEDSPFNVDETDFLGVMGGFDE